MTKFNLKTPCPDCPYIPDGLVGLNKERCKELWDYTKDKTFPCHKTIPAVTGKHNTEQQCVGALLVAKEQGYDNKMLILAGRLGIYDPSKIVNKPVYPSLKAMVSGHNKRKIK